MMILFAARYIIRDGRKERRRRESKRENVGKKGEKRSKKENDYEQGEVRREVGEEEEKRGRGHSKPG